MRGVRRVGVNECAGGDELGMLGKSFRRGRWREDVGGNEQSERDTESSAEHSAENEDRDAAPKFVHGSVSCVQGLRGLNSCADHRGDRRMSLTLANPEQDRKSTRLNSSHT